MRDVQGYLPLSVLATPLMGGVSSGSSAATANPLSPFSIKREETENQNQVPNLFTGPFAATTTVTATASSSACWRTEEVEVSAKDSKKHSTAVAFPKPPLTENNSTTKAFGRVNHTAAVADAKIKVEVSSECPSALDSSSASTNATQSNSSSKAVINPLESNCSSAVKTEAAPLSTAEKPGRGRPKKVIVPVEPVVASAIAKESKETITKESSVDKSPATIIQSMSTVSSANPNPTSTTTTTTPTPNASATAGSAATCDNSKRQKIDLKGPRVKHVCRSASIVLGQPLATFPLESLDTPPRPDSPSNVHMVDPQNRLDCSTCITEEEQQNLGLSPPATPVNSGDSMEAMDTDSVVPESNDGEAAVKQQHMVHHQVTKFEDASAGKGTRKATKSLGLHSVAPPPPVANRVQASGNMDRRNVGHGQTTTPHQPPMISIDFWENYDPVEISQTGFGLIVTEPVPLRSLCFLCGSLGSAESLMYCVCCCEPYHQYCIEDEYNVKPSLDETMNMSVMHHSQQGPDGATGHLNWLCPRCTVCSTCNMSNGTKLKCQKCQKNYHSTCLGTSKRLLGADRPLICATCLKCKSCGTCNVTKFVGNLPMCTACFKLRQRGNFCPLCQKCYEENDFDLKMMECGGCEKWVHARCEVSGNLKRGCEIVYLLYGLFLQGLTDEQYNMLSLLPESIEFFCRRCTRKNINLSDVWREAVAAEFKSGLLSVVKLLSKSRQACALLRLSPRKKSNLCICQPINSSRAIQFKVSGGLVSVHGTCY